MKLLLASLSAMMCMQLAAQDIVFESVNVIPMDKEEVLENQTVVVSKGKIVAMGNAGAVSHGKNATIVNARGKYLMPGLAEMHAHVPANDDIDAQKHVLSLFLLHGITTIRGMLGHPAHLTLRSKLKTGEILGPVFYTAGPALSGSSVKTPADAIKIVRDQKKAGYDFLKILPGLSHESYQAAVTTAKAEKIKLAGHVPFEVGVWNAITARQQTIDHLDGFVDGLAPRRKDMSEKEIGFFGVHATREADRARIPQLMAALKKNEVWVVPTQALAERWMTSARTAESFRAEPEMKYMDDKTLDNWVKAKSGMRDDPEYDSLELVEYINLRRKLINECNRMGVGLLLGCDAPQVFNVPGVSTHHELKYLVDAGLTPYEALKTGTVNVARFYGKSGSIGIVRKGASANLVLLAANPLADIGNTTRIEGVMLGGKWLTKTYIEQTLKTLEKSN